jgi:hypothetical protein
LGSFFTFVFSSLGPYVVLSTLFSNTVHLDRLERILTMVYVVQDSQNFSGLFPLSCIPKNNTTFRKLDLFPSSGGGGEDTYSVGLLSES